MYQRDFIFHVFLEILEIINLHTFKHLYKSPILTKHILAYPIIYLDWSVTDLVKCKFHYF